MERTLENLLALKPDPAYKKNIDPYARRQTKVYMGTMFPNHDGKCACGCGTKLKGRQTRWANPEHTYAGILVDYYDIVKGDIPTIRHYLYLRDHGICADPECDGTETAWEADHIIEVREGGGGCFLDGYQTLCLKCHKRKTKATGRKLKGQVPFDFPPIDQAKIDEATKAVAPDIRKSFLENL